MDPKISSLIADQGWFPGSHSPLLQQLHWLLISYWVHVCLMGTWESAFSVAAPRLWNFLPQEARLAPFMLSFRKQAKTFYLQASLPSVTSYLCVNFR